MNRRLILLHDSDDVATALTPLAAGETVTAALGDRSVSVTLTDEVPFGHKVALRPIARGEDVLKYGLPIGQALADIPAGAWVHVHNCRSERFGHRHEQYGLNA